MIANGIGESVSERARVGRNATQVNRFGLGWRRLLPPVNATLTGSMISGRSLASFTGTLGRALAGLSVGYRPYRTVYDPSIAGAEDR